MKYTFIK